MGVFNTHRLDGINSCRIVYAEQPGQLGTQGCPKRNARSYRCTTRAHNPHTYVQGRRLLKVRNDSSCCCFVRYHSARRTEPDPCPPVSLSIPPPPPTRFTSRPSDPHPSPRASPAPPAPHSRNINTKQLQQYTILDEYSEQAAANQIFVQNAKSSRSFLYDRAHSKQQLAAQRQSVAGL